MICPQCEAEYRKGFTRCSDCNVDLVDELPEQEAETEASFAAPDLGSEPVAAGVEPMPVFDPMTCPRCEQELEYVGPKRFHEGTNWGALGEIGEFFVKREQFDVYVCPNCGRVEFFIHGIGDEYRKQE